MSFLAYLRGIETAYSRISNCACSSIFSLPTRNWNRHGHYRLVPFTFIFSLPTRNWNPKGSEKCVNTSPIFSLPTRNWNSVEDGKPDRLSIIFSLPTRNWNVVTSSRAISPPLFLAYLRGIETYCRSYLRKGRTLIFSLPTRNWNSVNGGAGDWILGDF